jgi:hypothetical protein
MSDEWTRHDVTDMRLLCYASSLYFLLTIMLVVILETAEAANAEFHATQFGLLWMLSFGLFMLGMLYEQVQDAVVRLLLYIHPRIDYTGGDST